MRTLFLSVLVILALIPLVPSILSDALNQPLGDIDIPNWVKNTASWWSDDKIPDVTFVASIRYLMSQGIIHVEREQVEESEKCTFKGFEVVCPPMKHTKEIKEFHIAVNDGNCCLNWAYVGEEYRFQIKTFDEFRGSPTDDVTTTAKIISKDGELRHHFGMITTEDGIYRGSVIIPSMDWYAENILSVTAERNGIEKTVEKEFDVFRAESKQRCVEILCYTLTSVSNVVDTASLELDAPREIALFTKGSSTYVIVGAYEDDGFEIIDISNPEDPTSVGTCDDDSTCNATNLNGVTNVVVTTIGGTTYAVTISFGDSAISIFDISNPSSPTQEDVIENSGGRILYESYGLAVAEFGGKTYAVVASNTNNGISVIDISTPSSMIYKGHITDNADRELKGTVSVAIATINDTTYAVVTAGGDDGIAIIDISTDPTSPSYVGEMENDTDKELNSPNGVAITTIDGLTYAVVVGKDDGIAIIDISNPSSPVYVNELEDGTDTGVCTAANGERCLDGAKGVVITELFGNTYAVVTAHDDDGIEIIRVMG